MNMGVNVKDELKLALKVVDNKLDLMEFAISNDKIIEQRFKVLSEEMKLDSNNQFFNSLITKLSQWGLTINLDEKKVMWVTQNGRICNTYDIAKTVSDREGRPFLEVLKERCRDHYELRIKFNTHIKNEETFKYLAVNIGNLGLQTFGRFCFCFENNYTSILTGVFFIKANSLDSYSFPNRTDLDIDRLIGDLSTKRFLKELITLKHKVEIDTKVPLENWPDIICSDNCYVESVVIDELDLTTVAYVKIAKDYNDQFDKTALNILFNNSAIKTGDGDFLSNYFEAWEAIEKAGIKILIQ